MYLTFFTVANLSPQSPKTSYRLVANDKNFFLGRSLFNLSERNEKTRCTFFVFFMAVAVYVVFFRLAIHPARCADT
jgi:hypothetical protein